MNPSSTQTAPSIDGTTVIKPAFHHVNLKTTRLDEMVAWYGQVLGAEANFRNEMIAFLTNDGANHRVALTAFPGLEPIPNRDKYDGMHHTAFEYTSLDELLGSYLRLKRAEILPAACIDHGLTTSFYYLDPDGNAVELQCDNYGDWAQSTAFLCSDGRFAEDPIGKPVDPEQILAARQAGASSWAIHERAYAGEFTPEF